MSEAVPSCAEPEGEEAHHTCMFGYEQKHTSKNHGRKH